MGFVQRSGVELRGSTTVIIAFHVYYMLKTNGNLLKYQAVDVLNGTTPRIMFDHQQRDF